MSEGGFQTRHLGLTGAMKGYKTYMSLIEIQAEKKEK